MEREEVAERPKNNLNKLLAMRNVTHDTSRSSLSRHNETEILGKRTRRSPAQRKRVVIFGWRGLRARANK
jgi:hypothetical protein